MQLRQEPPNSAVLRNGPKTRSLGTHDSRADYNSRTVHFEEDRVVIMRRIHGMSMRITMPVAKYTGIGVRLPNPAQSRFGFEVTLVHPDPDLSVPLYESSNPSMVDAAIAEWSQYFKLPVLNGMPAQAAEHAALGDVAVDNGAHAVLGAITTGAGRKQRRRGSVLSKRRPRFYGRRKSGDSARMNLVHINQREIIARD